MDVRYLELRREAWIGTGRKKLQVWNEEIGFWEDVPTIIIDPDEYIPGIKDQGKKEEKL